ncbi:hypothetical protein [Nocardia sp. NPDC050406]|uniref:hypothetical protein n=1 Tax=Nocardia sp. NPDC050406 TaxID=3364318 RepID=UPI00379F64FB
MDRTRWAEALTQWRIGAAIAAPSGNRHATDRSRRGRIAWLFAVAALAVTAIAAVPAIAWADRFYRLRDVAVWALPVCVLGFAALIVLAPRLGWRRAWAWLAPAAVLALAVIPLVVVTMAWAALGSDDGQTVAVEASSDGRHEAVTLHVSDAVDTLCAVRLRERGGLFSRQTKVWTAPEGQRCPQRVSFAANNTIVIVDARGREITAEFDTREMRVTQLVAPPS